MLNVQKLDAEREHAIKDEMEMIGRDAEQIRNFYGTTAQVRKDYTIQMAHAEAERIKIVREAQARGLLAIRKAEADGFALIGNALANCKYPELVVKLAGLTALEDVAQSLGNGRATKIFLPHNLGDLFSLVAGWKEILDKPGGDASAPPTKEE